MNYYWYWLISGIFFITVEALAPVAYFLWFGLSALILGFITYFIELNLLLQVLLFSIFSTITTTLGRRFIPFHISNAHDKYINKKTKQLIGMEIILDVPIENGSAQVKIAETFWTLSGPDLPKGSVVKVIDVYNNRVIVEIKS